MKKMFFALLFLFLFALLAGCTQAKDIVIDMKGDEALTVKAGSPFKIRLEENPTTGYSWQVVQSEGGGVVELTGKDEFIRNSDRIGAGGVRVFEFTAVKSGKEDIAFEYLRPWETGKPPIRRYVLSVKVL